MKTVRSVAPGSVARFALAASAALGACGDPGVAMQRLAVERTGNGGGTVTSAPEGILCGDACEADFPAGVAVTLTAAPDARSAFAGWSGACSGADACTVAADGPVTVAATFVAQRFPLEVTRSGNGAGTVISTPVGVDCGGTCRATFPAGGPVKLLATPDAASTFLGWSGACQGAADCLLTVEGPTSVLAGFAALAPLRWSRALGGASFDEAAAVAVDSSGGVVVAGSFSGTATLGGSALTSAGMEDVFVARYSAAGAHLWSRRFGGTGRDAASAVVVDRGGSVWVAGAFQGSADFGGGAVTSAGGFDVFIVRISPAGAPLWSKRFGAAGSDRAWAMALDPAGNGFVAGSYRDEVDFGGAPMTSAGMRDVFVAAFSPAGSHLWSETLGGPGNDEAYGVAVDGSGNTFLAGVFELTADLGSASVTSAGGKDAFLAVFGDDGHPAWSRRFGGVGADEAREVAVDRSGVAWIAGAFEGTADFGAGPMASAGITDAFVVKFSPSGSPQWAKRFGAAGADAANAIAVDSTGAAVVTGSFQGTVGFGGAGLASTDVDDGFVVKLDARGDHRWSRAFGGRNNDAGLAAAIDASGGAIVAGRFEAGVQLGAAALTSAGGSDGFVASFAP